MIFMNRKRIAVFIGIVIVILAACAPPPTEAAATSTATPLPPVEAVDLGQLGKGPVSDVVWSPDGNLLAVRSSTGVYLHNTQTWEVVKTIPVSELEDRSLGNFSFSADGKNLVFITWDWNASVAFWHYDLQNGEFTLWLEGEGFNFRSAPVFSPDGKSFAILNDACEDSGSGEKTCSYALELRASLDGKLLYSLLDDILNHDEIAAFVFSPDRRQIASAGKDNLIRVWDTFSGKQLFKLQHDSNAVDVAYSPDGKVLASGSKDATVRFWDTQTGKNLFTLRDFRHGVQRVAYLDDGKKLLVGELYSNNFHEYDLSDLSLPVNSPGVEMMVGEGMEPYPHQDLDFTARTYISPDTRKMAVLLNDVVQIWDLDNARSILTLPEYNSRIFTWTFSPDSYLLAVADHNIHLWNVPAKKWLAMLPVHAYEIQAAAFSPDGKQLVVSAGGDLTFWDISTFQKVHEIKTEHGVEVLAYAPDGKRLAIAGGGYVQILDGGTGLSQQEFMLDSDDRPLALNFSADGKLLYYAGSVECLGWDLKSGKTLYSIQTLPDRYDQAAITSNLALIWGWDSYRYFDPNSTPQWNNALHFFDPATGQALYDFSNPDNNQYVAAALGSDGRLMALDRNEKIDLLDAASGQLLTSVDFHDAGHLSLSPNARILAAQSYMNPIHLWDVSSVAQRAKDAVPLTATPMSAVFPAPTVTPTVPLLSIESLNPPKADAGAIGPENISQLEKLTELGLGRIQTALWSPDGKSLALGGYPSVYIFDLNSSKLVASLLTKGEIMKLAYSPDGRLLAGQISNFSIQVWDVAAQQSLYVLDNLYCWNADMSFTSDGRVLSAHCGQATYRWNALNGQPLDNEETTVQATQSYGAPSPDGSLLVQAGGDTAYLMDAGSGKIIQSFEVSGMTPDIATFSPDGKTLLIWFYEYEVAPSGVYVPGKDFKSVIQLWNISTGQTPTLRASLPTGKWYQQDAQLMMGGFQMFSFTADSRRLATASGDGNVQVWSTQSGKLLFSLRSGGQVYFSPNGNQLVSIGDAVQVWDVTPGREPVEKWNISGLDEFQHLMALTENGLVTADDGTFRFRTMNGETIAQQPVTIKAPDEGMTISAISPDGKWLAYSTITKLVLGKNDSQEVNWQTLENFSDQPFVLGTEAVVFSPNNSQLAVVDADRKILLWRLDDLESQPLELGRELFVFNLIFSPDGKLLLGIPGASMEEQSLYLWDSATGALLRTWKTRGYQFAFHPSGETLAFTEYDNGKIFLYDLNTWTLVSEMQGQKYARKIAFSPDGSLLVTSGENGTEFWETSTGKLLKMIEGSTFWQLIFSPDGKLLVVTVGDGRVQVWGMR